MPGFEFQVPDEAGAAIIDRFARCVSLVEERILTEFGGHLQALIIPIVGDIIEGSTSQGGRLPNDLGISEQVRVARRLVIHMLGRLAPLADRVLVLTVAGNHDEARRGRVATPGDSWAIEAVANAADALELSGQYEHVTFIYPEPDDLSVTVDIGGRVVGATHGHVIGDPDRMATWLAGQALGRQPAGEADILLSGHFRTGRYQNLGCGRSWFMAPALDNSSPCFRNRKGVDSQTGMLSVELTPNSGRDGTGCYSTHGCLRYRIPRSPSLARVTRLHQPSASVYRH